VNYTSLIAVDRGGNIALILAIAVLAVGLVSVPLMPLFHFALNQKLKHIVARVYRIIGVVTVMLGFILIPVALVGVAFAVVVRLRGTGIPQPLSDFILGCAMWLAAPLIYIALGWFQMWFSERLAPEINWDNKKQRSLRRRIANLRRSRNAP
jgi:hypothetical protein